MFENGGLSSENFVSSVALFITFRFWEEDWVDILSVIQFAANCMRQSQYLTSESLKPSNITVDMGLCKRTTILINDRKLDKNDRLFDDNVSSVC